MAHTTLQPHNSSRRKITLSPRLPKKSSAAPKVYLGSMRRWERAHHRGGPGGGAKTRICASAGRPGRHTWPDTMAIPQLGHCHCGHTTWHAPPRRGAARESHVPAAAKCVFRTFESSISCRLHVLCMPAYSNIRKVSPSMKTGWWHCSYVPVIYLDIPCYTVI
jgi:hypothetical protein